MADVPLLISTIDAGVPEAVSTVASDAQSATADSNIIQAEILPGFQALLELLAVNGSIAEQDPLKQLIETSPGVAAFVAALQESIETAQKSTVEGLLLAQQLQEGQITQAQFETAIAGIELTPAQLLASVSPEIPGQIQQLLLAISNDPELTKQIALLEAAAEAKPTEQADQVESAAEIAPGVQVEQLDVAFDFTNTQASTELLTTQIEAALAAGESLESLKDTFVAASLAQFQSANPDLTAAQTAAIQAQALNFVTQFLMQLPSNVEDIQTAIQEGSLETLVEEAVNNYNVQISLEETVTEAFPATQTPLEEVAEEALPATQTPLPLEATGLALTEKFNTTPINVLEKLKSKIPDNVMGFFQNLFAVAKAIAEQNLKASAASLLSLRPQPRIMTGARAILKINNKQAALCTNVSYEISMDWSEVRGIDELIPNDLVPNSFSVKGSFSIYRIPSKSPIAEFMHADMFSGIIWPYTTIEIRDKRTDELIMLVKRCAITSRGESYTHGQLTSTNMSFVGIGFRDEEIPKVLPDKLSGEDDSGLGGLIGAVVGLFT